MIDRKKIAEHFDWAKYEIKRGWVEDGHEVLLIDVRNKEKIEIGAPELFCECDFNYEIKEHEDGTKIIVRTEDHRKCLVWRSVRKKVVREWQERCGDYWKDIGRKEAIMDIFAKAEAKDYLGQYNGGMIYLQDVAELLGVEPYHKLLKEVGELYAEERIYLNGNILADFVPRFRFPSEIRHILRYLYSDSADTSDFFLAELESAVADFHYEDEKKTHPFSSGKEIFPNDWPNIRPVILSYFGKLWLSYASQRGQKTLLDDIKAMRIEIKSALDVLKKTKEYAHELEEDAQEDKEIIRKLNVKLQEANKENEVLKKQLEEKEHKCEGKCAEELANLLHAAVIKMMKNCGVRIIIGAGKNCKGIARLSHFCVDMEVRSLKNLLFQLFNVDNQTDFELQMGTIGLVDALQKAEEGDKRMGFTLGINDIRELNGGEVLHCGRCKGKKNQN